MDNIDSLIVELLDKNGDPLLRDDIATDAGSIADPRFIHPLTVVASDPESDVVLAETAAESLAEIWVKVGHYDKLAVKNMPGYSQDEVLGIFSSRKPEWHKELIEFLAQNHESQQ